MKNGADAAHSKSEHNMKIQALTEIDIFKKIGWETKKAWKDEVFGKNGTLGRENRSETILSKFLIPSLIKINPNLPEQVYHDAYLAILEKQSDKK